MSIVRLDSLADTDWFNGFIDEPWQAVLQLSSLLVEILRGADSIVDPTASVDKSAKVVNSYIGPRASIYEGVTVRDTIVMADATVGHASEVARSIVGPNCMVPRFNYVGSSLLGAEVRLGGATMLASRRHDGQRILLQWGKKPLKLHATQFGSIIGDRSIVAYGCHLNPGSVVGHDSIVMPGIDLNGYVPPNTVLRIRQRTMKFHRRENLSVGQKGDDDVRLA